LDGKEQLSAPDHEVTVYNAYSGSSSTATLVKPELTEESQTKHLTVPASSRPGLIRPIPSRGEVIANFVDVPVVPDIFLSKIHILL
jgi:hypothetical protein